MDENRQQIQLTCKHEGCGKKFRIFMPKKAGTYQVKCPEGHVNYIKVVPKEIRTGQEEKTAGGESTHENVVTQLTCKHEGCGKKFRIFMPKKAGTYQVKCPEGHVNYIKIVPKEIRTGQEENTAGGESTHENVVTCPWECGTKFNFKVTTGDGVKSCNCPHCNGAIEISVKEGKIVSVERKSTPYIHHPKQKSKGKLTLVRFKGVFKRSYPLHLGQNTIGRYDGNLRCDIEIHNDVYASRRSVVIEVIEKEYGFLYRMSVLKAANPVMHNHKPLTVGEVVYLNYGDNIQLGKTIFNFEKD